jgi:hypothetical protein
MGTTAGVQLGRRTGRRKYHRLRAFLPLFLKFHCNVTPQVAGPVALGLLIGMDLLQCLTVGFALVFMTYSVYSELEVPTFDLMDMPSGGQLFLIPFGLLWWCAFIMPRDPDLPVMIWTLILAVPYTLKTLMGLFFGGY